MNKKEMVRRISEKTGLTKKDAETALNTTLEIIKETLAAGDKVQLVGFGTFEVRPHAPRTTRNPRTNELLQVPAGKSVKFRVSTPLKQLIK